jgi:hypothetical protein
LITQAEASEELVESLSAAIVALKDQVQKTEDNDNLAVVEKSVEDLKRLRAAARETVSAEEPLAPDDRTFAKSTLSDITRILVGVSTVIALLQLKTENGEEWGAHLFGTGEFASVLFDRFQPPDSQWGIQRMLADELEDLRQTVRRLTRVMTRPFHSVARIESNTKSIASELGCPDATEMDLDLYDAEAVCDQLDITPAELQAKVDDHEIFTVPDWTGETMYPRFQFLLGKTVDEFSEARKGIAKEFNGWPFAIWLYQNKDMGAGYYKVDLEPRGLWDATWNAPANNQFERLSGNLKADVPANRPLYRISRDAFTPFYFASSATTTASTTARPVRSGIDTRPGRFDLSKAGSGSMYLADSKWGAWREVLDREPVVTLHSLLGRTMWTLTPSVEIKVGDLTKYPVDLVSTSVRAATIQLADRLSRGSIQGMKYLLRSGPNEHGVVLFGNAGPTLPSQTGLGIWGATSEPAFHDAALWEYLAFRVDEEERAVVFRRLPGEFVVAS